MNKLKPNKSGRIIRLASAGLMRRRLLDLGFVPGAVVESLFSNAGKTLTAYGISGAVIALRKADAEGVWIEYLT